jgi:hypothetical protein
MINPADKAGMSTAHIIRFELFFIFVYLREFDYLHILDLKVALKCSSHICAVCEYIY